MIVKEQILKDVKAIENPRLLNQLFGYLRLVRSTHNINLGNKTNVLRYAGVLSNKDAKRISESINDNFNSIEGEW
jgi:hypothetical protein